MAEPTSYSQEWWRELRDDIDRRFVEARDSNGAIVELAVIYARIPEADRAEVNEVLAEWVESEDEGLRFDALAIVNKYRLIHAVPALRRLQARLESDTSPGAPYEWAKVNRILGNLTAPGL